MYYYCSTSNLRNAYYNIWLEMWHHLRRCEAEQFHFIFEWYSKCISVTDNGNHV